MLSKKEIYKQAYKELEHRRLQRQLKRNNNLKLASSICPEIKALSLNLSKTAIKLSKSILSNATNQSEAIRKIHEENIKTQSKINKLLIKNNLPPNFLSPPPICSKCEDFGFVDNKKCSCLIKLVKSILTKDLQKSSNFYVTSFKDFNLEYYPKEHDKKYGISPYEHMSNIFKICNKFADDFPNCSEGFVMCGLTGLGKTHLSLAIASEVMSKGFAVIYSTASEITRKMSDRYFHNKSNNEIDYLKLIVETDLFILDDLGTEFDSAFSKSAIFDIINSRIPLNRPTIINTNLSPRDLEKKYGERIVSRIFSTLNTLSFKGTDNRKHNTIKKLSIYYKHT